MLLSDHPAFFRYTLSIGIQSVYLCKPAAENAPLFLSLSASYLFLSVKSVYSFSQVSMDVLHQDFHEDDAYSRDCTAFKVRWVDLY